MKNIVRSIRKTGLLLAAFLLAAGMNVLAAPSVDGQTELTAKEGEITAAEYTITNDADMESVSITLSYDKDVLTYMSGSGGDNFAGNGGNGTVQLSSNPGSKTASFTVNFRGKASEDTQITITACTATVDGEEINVLTGESVSASSSTDTDTEEEESEEDKERATWTIGNRAFLLHNPGSLDGFEAVHLEIQGIDCRVLKHEKLDLYVVKLNSDNGSYRDYFVYNPDTGNVIPYVEMKSGPDTVYIIEPEEDGYVPTRYVSVDLGWGAKYTLPAYKHVIIDGVDEIQDDTNRYLLYGMNQDGEKNWYSYDYDKETLQLFDDTAYQGEQNYILDLEESVEGQKAESAYLLERYNTDMARRLYIILFMTILIIILLNVVVILSLKMKKMRMPDEEEEEEDSEPEESREPGEVIVGNLEEDETDFTDPGDDDEELEIIDLDDEE